MGQKLNRTALATAFGVTFPAIDAWVRAGCPYDSRPEKGRGSWVFDSADVADWRRKRDVAQAEARVRQQLEKRLGRKAAPQEQRDERRKMADWLPMPAQWLVPGGAPSVTVPEWEQLTGQDALGLAVYGLPFLPPAPGEKLGRISVEHAARWLLYFGGWLSAMGGDLGVPNLAAEAQRVVGQLRSRTAA